MIEFINSLKGKKTYIVAIAIGMLTTANTLGYIDDETFKMLLGLLNGVGLMTISAKINRVNTKLS